MFCGDECLVAFIACKMVMCFANFVIAALVAGVSNQMGSMTIPIQNDVQECVKLFDESTFGFNICEYFHFLGIVPNNVFFISERSF